MLVGCHRPGTYYWSNDLGQNWQPLDGAPSTIEVYQPWMVYLGKGKVACAGHYGADDPIKSRDQFISIHTFNVDVLQKTSRVKLWIDRDYDRAEKAVPQFLHNFAHNRTAHRSPTRKLRYGTLAATGPDTIRSTASARRSHESRREIGYGANRFGRTWRTFVLPEFDGVQDIHASYQLVVRFNADDKYPEFERAELPQLEFYANSGLDP